MAIDRRRHATAGSRESLAMDVHTTSAATADDRGSPHLLFDRAEMRSVFSNLSHELSRPLISLKAGFDLLLGEPSSTFTPDQRGHILTMVSLCDEMLRLTRSYLDFAGLAQGSRPLCLGRFTVGALVHELTRQFGPMAAGRHVHWETEVDSPQTSVVTDASRCQQIFGNLVSNALKYTPAGGRVRVFGRVDTDSWSVIVEDSGPGIPADSLEMVYEPFFRLARDEHSGVEGNGLGLAICRELVGQLQGRIQLSSVVGQGTSATVCFPLEIRSPKASDAG
jgi:signal transduction histidine kinase